MNPSSNSTSMSNAEEEEEEVLLTLTCDYLIIGAGTACLSFVDTLLTQISLKKKKKNNNNNDDNNNDDNNNNDNDDYNDEIKIIIVDKNNEPGGHWTKSYPFVKLHQQSCNYGVNSMPLSTSKSTSKSTSSSNSSNSKEQIEQIEQIESEPWDINDRATGKEICDYYKKVIHSFPKDHVQTFFNTYYIGRKPRKHQRKHQRKSKVTTKDSIVVNHDDDDNDDNDDDDNDDDDDDDTTTTHVITTLDGSKTIEIICKKKIVQCETNVIVPSMRHNTNNNDNNNNSAEIEVEREEGNNNNNGGGGGCGVPFPIDKSNVSIVPLNDLPSYFEKNDNDDDNNNNNNNNNSSSYSYSGTAIISGNNNNNNNNNTKKKHFDKYLVIGAGKSGVDAITYLLDNAKVKSNQIIWIVSQPCWYMIRDNIFSSAKPGAKFWSLICKSFFIPLLDSKSANEFFLNMERIGTIGRVDINNPSTSPSPSPSDDIPHIFRGATINKNELENLRSIGENVIKLGRVTSITSTNVILENGIIPFSSQDTLVVDCIAEDNFYGYLNFDENFKVFNKNHIRLGPLVSLFNPSYTSAIIAYLETEFVDDDVKNSFLFFPRGSKELKDISMIQMFMLNWYAEFKTIQQLDKYKPYAKFSMESRTNQNQPNHHGGMWGIIWAVIGPLQIIKKADLFVYRMENGYYKEDFPGCPLPGRNEADPTKFKDALRVTNTKKKKESSSSSGGGLLCCRSADAVIVETNR